MKKRFEMVSFGSAIVDIFVVVGSLFKKNNRFFSFPISEKIEGKKSFVCSGGGGTNTAVSFARAGFNSTVVCRLGNDFFSKLIEADLKKEGVDCSFLSFREEPTDISLVILGENGERTIIVCRGKTRLERDDFNLTEIDSDWFYLSSLEGNLSLAEEIINYAQRRSIKVAWNPGKRELLQKRKIFSLLGKTSVFILNKQETENLINAPFPKSFLFEKMARSFSNGRFLVVTDGRNGAWFFSDGKSHFLPSPKVLPVDETGAGDAFGSGFVVGLARKMTPEKAFELAMENGSSVVQKIGAKEGLLRNKTP